MSSGISEFAYTAPAPTASFDAAGPIGGSTTIALPEISVGPEPDLGGGALPGDGSYGDPIAGFHQINGQFADSQRAFSERMDAQSAQFNSQMQAQSDARAAQMQAQFESNMASMNAQRAAMFAPPPVTGPILPPNFSETAQVPAAPAPALPAAAPAADPFAATGEGGLGLSPVGTTGLTAFGLGGPAPGATPNLAFDPAPLGQGGIDAAPPAQPAPLPIGYGDQPLGVPVSQISRLTSADAQAAVGARLDAFRAAATPAAQDAALQDALNGAYAFRVQGGDAGPFDRIAERVAGDPRAEVELKVARDRAEAIVAAGVSGNIRALNDNGVNFGAQLYALQRSVTNDPDNALGPIGRALDGLRYGEGAGSAVNDIQAGATRQALTGLGFGREVQDATALDAARTEAAQIQQRQALAAMTPAERLSYIAGQALDAGALTAGPTLAMALGGGRPWGPAGAATGLLTPPTTPTPAATGNRPLTRVVQTPNGLVDLGPTLDRIANGGSFPHRRDGTVFRNREQLLPAQPPGYYTEFVHPTPGMNGPGVQRVIRGQGGEFYYSPDHYARFIPLN